MSEKKVVKFSHWVMPDVEEKMNADSVRLAGNLENATFEQVRDILCIMTDGEKTDCDWSGRSFYEICADIHSAFARMRVLSCDMAELARIELSPDNTDALSHMNGRGMSVADWLKREYPNAKVVTTTGTKKRAVLWGWNRASLYGFSVYVGRKAARKDGAK